MARVAIFVLNYNGRQWLAPCLTSLQQLTVPAERVVVDNASGDGSVDYLREHWPDVRVLAFDRNFGFAESYNRALAVVDCEWAVLLNNDATLTPHWLETLLAAAEQHTPAAILGGKLLLAGEGVTGRVIQCAGAAYTDAGTAFEVGWGEPDTGQYDVARAVAAVPGAAMLVRRTVFQQLGGFDAAYFAYLEDVDLCWRAWLAGFEVWYIPMAEASHHFGGSFGGRAAPFRIRQMQCNRYANMVKHFQASTLLSGLATSIGYDLYRVLEFGFHGYWAGVRALAAGTWEFGRNLPHLLEARQHLQASREVTDRALRERGLLVSALTALREYRRLGALQNDKAAITRR
ncbi:MAG: glycosyltransferase family 2 protein [Anaerolineales bacterium]